MPYISATRRRTMSAPEDVVIAGAGPNGLMLACELSLAGVRPLVIERLPERTEENRANGLVGQVVRMLDRRGLYERLSGSAEPPRPGPSFVFGAMPLDLRDLDDNPLYGLPVPQRRIEQVLEERAVELGVEIRRGHELTGLLTGRRRGHRRGHGARRALPAARQVHGRGRRRAQSHAQAVGHRLPRRHHRRHRLPHRARRPPARDHRPGDRRPGRARLRDRPAVHAPPHRTRTLRVRPLPPVRR